MATLPFDQRDGTIWFNGEFIPWQDAKVHVLTHGLHYASSAFEGERAYNGKVFKMSEHHQRLIDSGAALGFKVPYTVAELNNAVEELLKQEGLKDAYIRPVTWRGSEQLGISAQKTKVHVAIAAWEWPSYYPPEMREKGLKLGIAEFKRPSPETAPCRAKVAGLYMICTISKEIADKQGCQDAMLLDYRGYIAEATSANMFLVMNGELHTPTPHCILNGITRQTVMQLAKEQGIKVVERDIKPEELANTQEVFVTGTAAEVTPVGQIGDYTFTPGPVTDSLYKAYVALTGAA